MRREKHQQAKNTTCKRESSRGLPHESVKQVKTKQVVACQIADYSCTEKYPIKKMVTASTWTIGF
jgi:hypothetical protein